MKQKQNYKDKQRKSQKNTILLALKDRRQNKFSPYNIYRILTVHVFSSCSILSSVFKNDETGKVQKNENQKNNLEEKIFHCFKNVCVKNLKTD